MPVSLLVLLQLLPLILKENETEDITISNHESHMYISVDINTNQMWRHVL